MIEQTLGEQLTQHLRDADFEATRRGIIASAKLGDEAKTSEQLRRLSQEQTEAAGKIAVEAPTTESQAHPGE